jgi:hypothetical protein
MGDDRQAEPVFAHFVDGEAHTVDGNGAFGDDVGDLGGVDGDGVFGGVLAPLDAADGADGVDVALDDVALLVEVSEDIYAIMKKTFNIGKKKWR